MEIALHPLVEQILEYAAKLTPDNAERRWALEQTAVLGAQLFGADADPKARAKTFELRVFRIVSPTPDSRPEHPRRKRSS